MTGDAGWTIEFYHDERDRSDVEEFLERLDSRMRAKVARTLLMLSSLGEGLGMPHSQAVTGHRFRELRVQMGGNAVRIFYFAASGRRMILLHGFVKKSQKTPPHELEIAARRRDEYLR